MSNLNPRTGVVLNKKQPRPIHRFSGILTESGSPLDTGNDVTQILNLLSKILNSINQLNKTLSKQKPVERLCSCRSIQKTSLDTSQLDLSKIKQVTIDESIADVGLGDTSSLKKRGRAKLGRKKETVDNNIASTRSKLRALKKGK